jgi:hypothetical protein
MTSEEKPNGEDKRDSCCNFPFGNPEKMQEMMRNCCLLETKDLDCRSMMQMMMGKERRKAGQE